MPHDRPPTHDPTALSAERAIEVEEIIDASRGGPRAAPASSGCCWSARTPETPGSSPTVLALCTTQQAPSTNLIHACRP